MTSQEPSTSYEMKIMTEDEKRNGDKKPALASGKIFYKPGIIDEDTEEISAYESSTVESPMISTSYLRPHLQHSISLQRVPTYSSSIGQSTNINRQDTCRYVDTTGIYILF